jgi:membrane-associated phospholipid phosphatase
MGMEYIMHLQGFRSTPLDVVMRIGSFFGFEFFFVLVPLLAWWGDRRYQKLGINLFIFLLAIFFMVSILKVIFSRPRPLNVNELINSSRSSQIEKLEFSFPSGHAWASMSFFFLAKSFQNVALWGVAVLMSGYAVFSRVYFGVHYPHDILAGCICGIIFVILFTFIEQFLEQLFFTALENKSTPNKLKGFFKDRWNMVSIALLMVTLTITFTMDEALRKRQQGLIFVPFCLLGIILARPFLLDLQCSSAKFRVYRVLVGVPFILVLHLLYSISTQSVRPLIAMMVGVLIFVAAPNMFVKLKLTRPEKAQ